MTIRKIEAGRVITQDIDSFIGYKGTIWYDEETGEMRLYDGNPGGISLGSGGGGYILHTATITRLGGVRIGVGIDVSPNGTISVNTGTPYVLTIATTSTLGGVIIGAGIDVSPSGVVSVNTGTPYVLNTATADTLGGVKIGTGIDISADGTISVNTSTPFNLSTATTTNLGGVKIGDGINVSADGTISVNSGTYFTLTAGTDTAVSTSTGNVTVWVTSTLQSVTDRGSTTSNAINITSIAATTSTTTGALVVAGGVGIGGNLFVGGDITGPNGSLVLIATTSTAPNRQNGQLWFNSEDGRAYIKYDGNWVDLSPTIVPPISTYLGDLTIDGTTISTIDSTLTNIYIDSILDVSGAIYTNNYLVSTLTNIVSGIGIAVSRTNSGTVTVSNTGVLEIQAGVDTSISTATGVVVINNTSTLQTITNRGSTTSNAINITAVTPTTSTTTGALVVAGGVGIGGDIFIDGDIRDVNGSLIRIATTSTAPTRKNGQLWFNSEDGRAYIKYDGNWVDLSPTVVPPISTYLGDLTIDGTTISTIDSTLTNIYIDSILNVSGEIYTNNYLVSTLTNISSGIGISVSRTNSGTVTINNTGVLEIQAGVDTSISTATGVVIINNTGTLQTITNRGSTTSNAINITSVAATTSTTTGALIVAGGVGIGGDIFIDGDIKNANGSLIHIATTSTAPTRDNGQLWFNSEDGRGYIKYDGTWVDFNPSIVPPTSTYLDGLVVEGTTIRTVDTTATTVYIDRNLDVAGEIFRDGISIGYGYTGSFGYSGSQGYTGSAGYTGSSGYTGSEGYTGSAGAGYTGSKGEQGTPGTSVKIVGSTSTSTLLVTPWTGDIGDGFIIIEDGHLWVWTDPWVDVGQIIGYTGSRGDTGYVGSEGYSGSQGYSGSIGYTGSAVIGLTSDATSTVTLSAGFKFIPETDKIQDLGSPTNRFGKIYLAGQTIDLGGTIISTALDGSVLIQKSNGDLERLVASSLKLGSTGTDGVIFDVANGILSIHSTLTNFDNLSTTGTIFISSTSPSTSTNTGALIVSGGVGISGDIALGGKLVSDIVNLDGTNGVKISTSGSSIVWSFNSDGSTKFPYYTFPASTGTAGQVLVDVLGDGILSWQDQTGSGGGTGSTSTATLQLVTDQGATTTNAISILNFDISTSTNTGALIVGGGVGIGGDVNIGGALYANTTSFAAGAEILTTGTIDLYAVTLTGVQTLTNKTIIVPNGGAIYFDSDIALSQAHGALLPYKQTSSAPKMYTNKDFNTGILWMDAGEYNPDDGWTVIDSVADSTALPVGYVGNVYDAYITLNDNHVWYWAALSITDLKPGDIYYDDIGLTVNLCFLEYDGDGNAIYSMLDITPK